MYFIYSYLSVFTDVYTHVCVLWLMCGDQRIIAEVDSLLLPHLSGEITRLGSTCFYGLNHPPGPYPGTLVAMSTSATATELESISNEIPGYWAHRCLRTAARDLPSGLCLAGWDEVVRTRMGLFCPLLLPRAKCKDAANGNLEQRNISSQLGGTMSTRELGTRLRTGIHQGIFRAERAMLGCICAETECLVCWVCVLAAVG